MAVGAYMQAVSYMKAVPLRAAESSTTAAFIPFILIAPAQHAVVAGIFGIIIGIPALRTGAATIWPSITRLGFGEMHPCVLNEH